MSNSAVAAAVAAAAAEKKALLVKLQDREREIAELRRECKTASAQAKSAAALGEIHRTDLDKMRRTAEAMAAERTQAALAQRTTEREVVALRHELKRALLVQQHVLQQQLLSSTDASSPVPSPVPSPAETRPSTAPPKRSRSQSTITSPSNRLPHSGNSSTRASATSSPSLNARTVAAQHPPGFVLNAFTAESTAAPASKPSPPSSPSQEVPRSVHTPTRVAFSSPSGIPRLRHRMSLEARAELELRSPDEHSSPVSYHATDLSAHSVQQQLAAALLRISELEQQLATAPVVEPAAAAPACMSSTSSATPNATSSSSIADNDSTSESLTVVEFEDISHASSDAEAAAAEAANAVAIAVSTAVAESEALHAAKLNELQSNLDAERTAHAQTRQQLDQFREQHNQHNVHLLADMLQSQLTAARTEADRASSSQRALMQRCRTLEESYAELQRNSDDTARKLNARATAAANSIRDIQAERERMKLELDEQRYAIMYGDTEKDREIDRLRSTITETQTVLEMECKRRDDEIDQWRQRLRKVQQRAVDDWMFDGQSDLI